MSLSPPNPAVSHLFCCVIGSALSSGRGILLLPITGFSGITQTKPQIIAMTTTDQIRMLVPSEAVTAGDPPSLSVAARRVPELRGPLTTMSPCLALPAPGMFGAHRAALMSQSSAAFAGWVPPCLALSAGDM